MSFQLYPAIDVRDGRVVRLKQGDYAQETRYADDPLTVATRYASAGAAWLHLVDLDAAREGTYSIGPLLSLLKAQTSLKIQSGGGVRDESGVERLLAAGADRVVIGSLAVDQPERVIGWLRRFGEDRITVALDTRQVDGVWVLPTHGWTQAGASRLEPLLQRYAAAGLRHLLCTDIGRDGMLSGPNVALYSRLAALVPGVQLQASGGASVLGDISAARDAGCAGIVLGKALLEGCFSIEDAQAIAPAQAAPC